MPEPIRLVVGLGNPGSEYTDTRHNAGFWFVDALARAAKGSFRANARFFGDCAEVRLHGASIRLLKPSTYMNKSGQSVAALANYFRIPVDAILVVHDEIDLPSGVARLKIGGGHGGHNGLRDIAVGLGGSDFIRLRIGVGHPGHKEKVHGHVLSRAGADESADIHDAIARALTVMPEILMGAHAKAMNELNRRPDKPAQVLNGGEPPSDV